MNGKVSIFRALGNTGFDKKQKKTSSERYTKHGKLLPSINRPISNLTLKQVEPEQNYVNQKNKDKKRNAINKSLRACKKHEESLKNSVDQIKKLVDTLKEKQNQADDALHFLSRLSVSEASVDYHLIDTANNDYEPQKTQEVEGEVVFGLSNPYRFAEGSSIKNNYVSKNDASKKILDSNVFQRIRLFIEQKYISLFVLPPIRKKIEQLCRENIWSQKKMEQEKINILKNTELENQSYRAGDYNLPNNYSRMTNDKKIAYKFLYNNLKTEEEVILGNLERIHKNDKKVKDQIIKIFHSYLGEVVSRYDSSDINIVALLLATKKSISSIKKDGCHSIERLKDIFQQELAINNKDLQDGSELKKQSKKNKKRDNVISILRDEYSHLLKQIKSEVGSKLISKKMQKELANDFLVDMQDLSANYTETLELEAITKNVAVANTDES